MMSFPVTADCRILITYVDEYHVAESKLNICKPVCCSNVRIKQVGDNQRTPPPAKSSQVNERTSKLRRTRYGLKVYSTL